LEHERHSNGKDGRDSNFMSTPQLQAPHYEVRCRPGYDIYANTNSDQCNEAGFDVKAVSVLPTWKLPIETEAPAMEKLDYEGSNN
jgi:hypothetical protein